MKKHTKEILDNVNTLNMTCLGYVPLHIIDFENDIFNESSDVEEYIYNQLKKHNNPVGTADNRIKTVLSDILYKAKIYNPRYIGIIPIIEYVEYMVYVRFGLGDGKVYTVYKTFNIRDRSKSSSIYEE